MPINLTVNGLTYPYPITDDEAWGTIATTWAQAISQEAFYKSSGTFVLTKDANFGPSFGLRAVYFSGRTANVAATGFVRLSNNQFIAWRTAANTGDIALGIDANNILTYNSLPVVSLNAYPILKDTATGIISHANSGLTVDTYGSSLIVPVITVDTFGHITAISNVAIDLTIAQGGYDHANGAFITANAAFTKANGAAQQAFITLNVAGQSNVVADSNADTLVLVSGTGILITTDAPNDTITISATGSAATDGFARDHANGAFDTANAAFAKANIATTNADAAFARANAAYANSNTAIYTAAQIRANISNAAPVLYDSSTGTISLKALAQQTEVNFGSTGVAEASFTITDANVTSNSFVTGSVAYTAPTGKDLDELDMDAFDIKFSSAAGSFIIYVKGLEGYVEGNLKINYHVGGL